MRIALLLLFLAVSPLFGCDLDRQESVKITNEGIRALDRGEIEVAIGYLKNAVDTDATNTNAGNLLGQVLFHDLGDLKEAKAVFERVLRQDPAHLDTHYQMGRLLYESKDVKGAKPHIKECLNLDAEHGLCYQIQGKLAEDTGDLEAANKNYRKAIQFAPRNVIAYNRLGDLYERVLAEDEALQVYKEAVRLNPYDPECRQRIAAILLRRGQPSDAANYLLESSQLAPNEHELLFSIGSAYTQAQDSDRAAHFLSRYLASPQDGRTVDRPNEGLARVMLENIRKGPRLVAPVPEDSKERKR